MPRKKKTNGDNPIGIGLTTKQMKRICPILCQPWNPRKIDNLPGPIHCLPGKIVNLSESILYAR